MVAYDNVMIFNMALSSIGIGQKVVDADENSAPARECAFWYDIAVARALAAFEWPFAMKPVTLGLVEAFTSGDWRYSYRYPNLCVGVVRIVSPAGLPEFERIPFRLGQDDAGRLIFSDEPDAVAEIVASYGDPGEWPDAFAECVSTLLAEKVAPGLRVDRSRQLDATGYMDKALMAARGIAAKELVNKPRPPAASVSARGSGRPIWPTGREDWRSYPGPG